MSLSAKDPSAQGLSTKVKNYENELAKLKTGLRKAEIAVSVMSDRNQLFSGASDYVSFLPRKIPYRDLKDTSTLPSSMEQRERLLKTTESYIKTDDVLDEAIDVSNSTIMQGIEVMEELDRQKELMTRVIEKVKFKIF